MGKVMVYVCPSSSALYMEAWSGSSVRKVGFVAASPEAAPQHAHDLRQVHLTTHCLYVAVCARCASSGCVCKMTHRTNVAGVTPRARLCACALLMDSKLTDFKMYRSLSARVRCLRAARSKGVVQHTSTASVVYKAIRRHLRSL